MLPGEQRLGAGGRKQQNMRTREAPMEHSEVDGAGGTAQDGA
jgi:hypothetical protein